MAGEGELQTAWRKVRMNISSLAWVAHAQNLLKIDELSLPLYFKPMTSFLSFYTVVQKI